jgi:hypothetical protein
VDLNQSEGRYLNFLIPPGSVFFFKKRGKVNAKETPRIQHIWKIKDPPDPKDSENQRPSGGFRSFGNFGQSPLPREPPVVALFWKSKILWFWSSENLGNQRTPGSRILENLERTSCLGLL